MRIAALTTGRTDPSARFRVRQHIEPLARAGFDVVEYIPRIDKHSGLPSAVEHFVPSLIHPAAMAAWSGAKLAARMPGFIGSFRADLVWLNRELMHGRHTLERFLRPPYVLDVDDAVWRAQPHGVRTMSALARNAAVVLAGNRYLADWFSAHTGAIEIVPTAIDTERFHPSEPIRPGAASFTIGWTGTRGNFQYLYDIEEVLAAFLQSANARLLVVAEEAPMFTHIDPSRIALRRWTPAIESEALREMDVGLMPLPDNVWTRGKCSFKMLQYMATGLPVVVSPVGMNAELLDLAPLGIGVKSPTEWLDALKTLHADRGRAVGMGIEGRRVVVERFSRDIVSAQLAAIFGRLRPT